MYILQSFGPLNLNLKLPLNTLSGIIIDGDNLVDSQIVSQSVSQSVRVCVCVRTKTFCLSVKIVSLNIGCNLSLPFVSIIEQLFFVIEKFFMSLCRKFKVWPLNKRRDEKSNQAWLSCCLISATVPCTPQYYVTFKQIKWQKSLWRNIFFSITIKLTSAHLYNGIHRTRLLAKPAVNTFCHVDIVTGCSPAAISTRFSFDCNGLGYDSRWIYKHVCFM